MKKNIFVDSDFKPFQLAGPAIQFLAENIA